MNKELDTKALMLFLGFYLGADVQKKFDVGDTCITTLNNKGEERIIPIEWFDLNTSGFVFSKNTFNTESKIAICITNKNIFIFNVEKIKGYIKENSSIANKFKEIWLVKIEDIPYGFVYILPKGQKDEGSV